MSTLHTYILKLLTSCVLIFILKASLLTSSFNGMVVGDLKSHIVMGITPESMLTCA